MLKLSRRAGSAIRKVELIYLSKVKMGRAPVVDEDDGEDTISLYRETFWDIEQWWLDQLSKINLATLTADQLEYYTEPQPFCQPQPGSIIGDMATVVRSRRVKVRILPRERLMDPHEFEAAVAKAGGRVVA